MQSVKSPQDYDQLTTDEQKEFRQAVLAENLKRMRVLVVVGALANIVVLAVNWIMTREFGATSWLQAGWITMSLLYLAAVGKAGTRPFALQHTLVLGMVSLTLLLVVWYTGQLALAQGNTLPLILAILVIYSLLVLSPVDVMMVAAPSLLYLGYILLVRQDGGWAITKSDVFLNLVLVSAVGIVVAYFFYSTHRQRFKYEAFIRRNNKLFETLATYDSLTDIPNRHKIEEIAASIQGIATREKISVAVLMFDLDNFKAYNDSCGYLAGDELLKSASTAMKNILKRKSDFFGRYGGEEFLALLPSTYAAGAAIIAERMRLAVSNLAIPYPGSGEGVATVSGGLAVGIPGQDLSIDDLIQQAGQALYRAKQSGKNRVES